ncbi:hypothetical protein DMB65_12170 [Flavobacterium cheongpyeongense]|uniref:Nucleoid-associated protein n=1 Tax=Flavobacterium cheongpyeongense TaxID=2212651 RepID=A0A2V4BNR9_9FLAO|nr:nucleoid-associated protein [Flavobacterium cheongpyeongense]PXY40656.1 hypothetical protein DMB65_12170 [Flavobacterium cheongpyeongense]
MDIRKLTLHKIDISKNIAEKIEIDISKETIIEYVDNLVNEILDSPNKRMYRFKNGDTQVKSSLIKLVAQDSEVDKIILHNAERLLEKELNANEQLKSKRLNVKIQKGSLLHLHFVEDDVDKILVCKVEHDEYLNELNFDKNNGLNTKKKVFKSFLMFLDSSSIYLNDKNNSKYWWDDFLELEQVNNDNENTEKSVHKIMVIVDSYKKEFLLDGTLLRNAIIGHFKSNENFNLTELLDSVVESYTPINQNFPLKKISERVNKLALDSSFDNQFVIVQQKVNKRIVNKIRLGSGLYLSIEDFVKNLDEILRPFSDNQGNQGITIISEEAYEFVNQMKK